MAVRPLWGLQLHPYNSQVHRPPDVPTQPQTEKLAKGDWTTRPAFREHLQQEVRGEERAGRGPVTMLRVTSSHGGLEAASLHQIGSSWGRQGLQVRVEEKSGMLKNL